MRRIEDIKDHEGVLKFLKGCQLVRDVAALYFPCYNDKSSAVQAFQEFIDQNAPMRMELEKACYTIKLKFLSPTMLKIIVKYWGLPDAVSSYIMSLNDKIKE